MRESRMERSLVWPATETWVDDDDLAIVVSSLPDGTPVWSGYQETDPESRSLRTWEGEAER